MYTQLWLCGNCGWGTFEYDNPRKMNMGILTNCNGERIELCTSCMNLLEDAPRYELDSKIKNPTRKVSE